MDVMKSEWISVTGVHLESYDPAKKGKNVFLRESHVFGGMVEVSVDEILWEDKIPAYIVTIIPQMKAEETKNYYLYNRSIDRVVKKDQCSDRQSESDEKHQQKFCLE